MWTAFAAGNWCVWRVAVSPQTGERTGEPRLLASGGERAAAWCPPAPSPDGRSIAYVTFRTRYELLVAERKFQGSAAEMYRTARRGSEYDWVLAAEPREVLAGNRYLDHVSSQRREIVTQVGELRDDLDVEQQAADAEK